MKKADILDLEGWNTRFGWHAYLTYNKVAVHKDFLNHIVRISLYKVWDKYYRLLEPKIPWWASPVEMITVKKTNMGTNWATYQQLIKVEQGQLKIKLYEEIKQYCNGWIQYHQIVHILNQDKKIGFGEKKSFLQKELVQMNKKTLSRMYDLLLEWELKDEMLKDVMIKWAQDFGHNIMLAVEI